MKSENIDLSTFKVDHNFYKELKLLITIKSFDLQAIRERYLKNRNKKSNRTGSVNRRETATGGIAEITLKNGSLDNLDILTRLPEPRGVDCFENVAAFSSENKVHILDGEKLKTITNPWFSYIHTVDINRKDKNHLLVSSSGFDCIFEYSISEKAQTFEWFAWENGFNEGIDPETGEKIYLTRKEQEAEMYQEEGKRYLFIQNPKEQILPTAKRAAFINSVVYDPEIPQNIIGTFFHEGAVYSIDRESGKAEKVLDGLKNPHGGMKIKKNHYMGTSTTGGEIISGNLDTQKKYIFKNLQGKPDMLGDMEWIQNTKLHKGLFIAVDSNRNAILIIHPEKKLISPVSFNPNWAVQDLVISTLNENQKYIIQNLKD
jgi:hypothetical protein